ncbi:DUF4167 domain-containing protein [Lichenibacterium dinghuense]|uniref:DUF4167 domain-containing protein n=1 Tax=Lichenibacterium dinghuense TaxID=2895977 RepID=UPI001F2F419D|nr:DUF4167 domain-containing protein [Lichenibacterium sp. 6Y81]
MRGGRPNNNGGNRKGPNPLTRSYESNGPDVKIRGNAHHVAEKYLQLARDAQSSGDPVAAESYLQHAEHYFRLIASAQAAQAGYARQPDAVDTEVDDDDDSGIPDRFASPQPAAPAPFVPQAAAQPYQGEQRQPYTGERQPYGDRQNGQGGERQPYNGQGDRQPYNDRNNYNRQDRNNQNRRPYRDNNGNEIRADDRQQGQQSGDRPYGDRQSRRERFAQERLERQERQANGNVAGQDRPYNDRGYDRPRDGDRYREEQPAEPTTDFGSGEQPRVEAVPERQVERQPEQPSETALQPAPVGEQQSVSAPVSEAQPEVASRRAEAPRRRERAERSAPAPVDDAPGLPSFITAPPRAVAPSQPAAEGGEPSLTTATAFPGDDADEAPKFPRRRRRTTRATAEAEAAAPAAEPSASDD